jgi:CheY-like chemotaxis protein
MNETALIHDAVVLYVENVAMSREVMAFMLRNAVHMTKPEQIHIFESSDRFIERLHALPSKPDVVLLDIHMQPLDGFAVLDLLRAQPEFSTTPVVALTASVMNEEISQLRQAGFSACISKPIRMATLPGVLQRILNGECVWEI